METVCSTCWHISLKEEFSSRWECSIWLGIVVHTPPMVGHGTTSLSPRPKPESTDGPGFNRLDCVPWKWWNLPSSWSTEAPTSSWNIWPIQEENGPLKIYNTHPLRSYILAVVFVG